MKHTAKLSTAEQLRRQVRAIVVAPPTQFHKVATDYTRKVKYRKGWAE